MNHHRILKTGFIIGTLFVFSACAQNSPEGNETNQSSEVVGTSQTEFVVDPSWPKPLPNNWVVGQVSGIAVDAQDHIWMVHRPLTITPQEAGAVQDPPLSECCVPAPSVIEFDQEGNVVQAWGGPKAFDYDEEGNITKAYTGPDKSQRWPRSEHGLFVDHQYNVWIASNNRTDQIVIKFSKDGTRLMEIGNWGITKGSNDTEHLGQPTDITVDPEANEVYITDGYGNRRIIVFDAETGEYKRHWGAYGETPDDDELPAYEPNAEPDRSFRSPIHSVRISNDKLVYTSDRVNNRIQVFQKDGAFVKEAFLATNTRSMGSVWDMDFSRDEAQTYVYVPDGTNNKVWILKRDDLTVVNSFGTGGKNAGNFGWVHNIAMDSKGNLYTSEVETGKRIQKFKPAN